MAYIKERKKRKAGLALALFFSFVSMLVLALSIVSAQHLNLTVNAKLNYHNTDFYAITNDYASAGFDSYDFPASALPYNYSMFYSNISNATSEYHLAIDSWPLANRVLEMVYFADISYTGTLNLTWDNNSISYSWPSVTLTDFGTDNTYTTNVSSPVDMKTTSFYNASNSADTRYIKIELIYDVTGPNITLLTPQNFTITNQTSINFTANISSIFGIANATIKIYNETGLYNATKINLGGALQAIIGIVITLSEGIYHWFVEAYDIFANLGTTQAENFTLTIDTTAPILNIVFPASNGLGFNNEIEINYTVSDPHLDSCWWSNSTNAFSIACGTNITGVTWREGNNTVTIYANDTAGNVNSINVTFYVDTLPPIITLIAPSSGISDTRVTWILEFNVSDASELGNCTAYVNNAPYLNESYINRTLTNNISVNLGLGTYYWYVNCTDFLGNTGNSTTRTFTRITSGCTPDCGDTSRYCEGVTYSNGCPGGENACTGTKQPICDDPSTIPCGQTDPTSKNECPCTEIGTKCGYGEECNGVSCIVVCTDECTTGSKGCSSTTSYKTCGNYDSDICLEWSSELTCPSGTLCQSGNCVEVSCTSDANCNDNNPCTDDTCNPLTFKCSFVNNKNSCNDNNLCTEDDRCSGGVCSGTRKVCESGKVCDSATGNCVEGEPPKELPKDLPQTGTEGCTSNFICGEWSECDVDYNVEDLIISGVISGVQTRICHDKNNCYPDFPERAECRLKEEVIVETRVWCNQEYIEVRNKEGKILSRLKALAGGKFVRLDINLEGEGYCAYCYDGIKDYDEEDIDCGGSCIACAYKKPALEAPLYATGKVRGWFFIILAIIFLASLVILTRTLWIESAKAIAERILYPKLMRQYMRWKKEGYDVEALKPDIETIRKEYK